MTETRDTLVGLTRGTVVLWYCLVAVSLFVFAIGVVLLVRKYRQGRAGGDEDRTPLGLAGSARLIATHAWIRRRDLTSGLGHLLVFYGFVVLLIGTLILAFQDDLTKPVFGWSFWQGEFYLGYSLLLDIFGVGLVVGLAILASKRLFGSPRLNYEGGRWSWAWPVWQYIVGDWLFIGALLFLAVTGFLLEALRIAQTDPSFEVWSPVGWSGAQLLRATGIAGSTAGDLRLVLWWIHSLVALAFVAAIPFTKALHMIVAPVSLAVTEEGSGRRLEPMSVDAKPDEVGFGVVSDLSPRLLVEVDACTRCGKCHVACPAALSGYPLSPRELVLTVRRRSAAGSRVRAFSDDAATNNGCLLTSESDVDTVWSCVECMACEDICPVGVEHLSIINGLRRRLIEQGRLDETLQAALERIYKSGNSFGESGRRRGSWTEGLPFRVKDARRERVDLLWFVGDYASFDPRNQSAAKALAAILNAAQVDFGILYESEQNAGNDVRRTGEEGLFVELAERNAEVLSGCNFTRILTSDPHSYNALKNEYRQIGGDWEVVHHSELLYELLRSGKLPALRQLNRIVTYHDPCTLGRYNDVYEPPREVLRAIGCQVVEMPRSRDNSFCCGAGGGHIWMSETHRATPRPSEFRIEEAASLGKLDHFVVSCPKDVSVFEDAIKTTGRGNDISLAELSELVVEALGVDGNPAG